MTPWAAAHWLICSSYLLEFAQTHAHWVGEAIQPSHLLLPPSLPAPDISFWVFSNESVLWVRWPKYWSFSISISPSTENSWLISFRIAWLDFAVQGTLKSLLQNSLKASVLWHSVFFMVQLSHPYMTTWLWLDRHLSAKWCLCFLIHCLGMNLRMSKCMYLLISLKTHSSQSSESGDNLLISTC